MQEFCYEESLFFTKSHRLFSLDSGLRRGGCLFFLSVTCKKFLLLLLLPLFTSQPGLFDLNSPGFGNIRQLFGSDLLSLLLMNEFHKQSFVLEDVSFSFQIELVIQMTINLLLCSILLQQSPKNTKLPDPQGFLGHTGIGCTFPFTSTGVSTLPSGFSVLSASSP